jgi:hypothetical protein
MDYSLFHLDVDETLDLILWKRQWMAMDIKVGPAPDSSSHWYESNFAETLVELIVRLPQVGDGSVQIQPLKAIGIHDRYEDIEQSARQANLGVSLKQTECWPY